MQKPVLQQRPAYPIESVDNALRLLQLLRDGGRIRLTEAARELEIAPSTVHRLMAMLSFRGFAMQDDSRRYVAGPALGTRAIGAPWLHRLRREAQEPMEILCSQIDETVNLVVRVGVSIRFLRSVEASQILRIGDRTGTVISALTASTGKALLAHEPPALLRKLYRSQAAEIAGTSLDDEQFDRFMREIAAVRTLGYGISREETETGVCAIGTAVFAPDGRPVAGLSVSVPSGRFESLLTPERIALLMHCRDEVGQIAAAVLPAADQH